jgi:serine/threonine-protein kinase
MPDDARFCAQCGTPVPLTDQPTDFLDAETTAPAVVRAPAPQRPASRPRSGGTSGWLSSSAVDHGRFEPGTVLADRYRIVARLGQGGMGEVYRADDLKLGQPVALKFLPAALERDPQRLAQFHNEVRLARQIAHKNVCRMYDVGDSDGLPFLTMEYVDGEDLATLLRRIGRLPEDKALDVARQLCAGLAAAHERGVLHRDLKPANVMVDGAGQVRITDFGLAAVTGAVDQVRVGTPAYMAPEQLSGQEVTAQSDIYALGLVLYEVFTGRRAYSASSVGELVRQHQEGAITPPTAIVRDLDPAVERTILRCLDPEPRQRPRSALAVSAGLPGGDPLAAALAAGETPSPEMVAAAGERQAAPIGLVAAASAAVLFLLVVSIVFIARYQLTNRVPFDKPPAVLVDRAQQALAALGYGAPPVATHWGFHTDGDYLRHVRDRPDYARAQDPFGTRPAPLLFYYRASPRRLVPLNPVGAITLGDPPLVITGMTLVTLDPLGRLEGFHAVPPQHDLPAGPAPTADWDVLFRLAGLDRSRFTPAEPEWLPRGEADTRMAWTGTAPERLGTSLRLEAASWRGRVTFFQTVWPWTRAARMQEAPVSQSARLMSAVNVGFFFSLLVVALVVSRMNVRAGRGDHRGALRLVAIATVAQMITWLFNDPHGGEPEPELNRFFASLGEALFAGGMLYVMYLALEPAVRRYWPDSLLGWTRLLHGQIVDARVGRDVLAGLAGGAVIVLLIATRWPLQAALGHEGPVMEVANLRAFEGPFYVLGLFSSVVGFQATFNAMWCVFAIVGLKRLLHRMWLVAIVASLFFTLVAASGLYTDQPGFFWLHLATAVTIVSVIVVMAIRFGLLAAIATFLVTYWVSNIPWTINSGRWDFTVSATAFALLALVLAFGAWAARAPASSHS